MTNTVFCFDDKDSIRFDGKDKNFRFDKKYIIPNKKYLEILIEKINKYYLFKLLNLFEYFKCL